MGGFACHLHPFSFLISSLPQLLCSEIDLGVVGILLSWAIQFGQTPLLLQRAYLPENILEEFVSHLATFYCHLWGERYPVHDFQLLIH
jgi:hypothetical protein